MYETRYMQGMSNFNADQLLLVVWVVAISGLISFTLPTFITANHFLHQSALEVIVTVLLIAPDDFTNNLAGTVRGTGRWELLFAISYLDECQEVRSRQIAVITHSLIETHLSQLVLHVDRTHRHLKHTTHFTDYSSCIGILQFHVVAVSLLTSALI